MHKCPIFNITNVLGKKWTIVLLQEVALNGNKGFNYIFKRIGKISPKLLSQRLKDFEKHGLMTKEVIVKEIPLRTTYELTQKGEELLNIIILIKKWYVQHNIAFEACGERECVKCPLF